MSTESISAVTEKNRILLKEFILDSKFERLVNNFFNYWFPVVKNKANKSKFLIENYENFRISLINTFQSMSKQERKKVLLEENPILYIYNYENLKLPKIFNRREDQNDFKNILESYKL